MYLHFKGFFHKRNWFPLVFHGISEWQGLLMTRDVSKGRLVGGTIMFFNIPELFSTLSKYSHVFQYLGHFLLIVFQRGILQTCRWCAGWSSLIYLDWDTSLGSHSHRPPTFCWLRGLRGILYFQCPSRTWCSWPLLLRYYVFWRWSQSRIYNIVLG